MFGLLTPSPRNSATGTHPEAALPDDGDFRLSGLTVGTRVATHRGWRPVETITAGERVLTFDNGLRLVAGVSRGTHFAAGDALPDFAKPVNVPIGTIGNHEAMVLLPEQPVLVESDAAEAMTGDPFALVPAKALVGFRGIEGFRSLRPIEVITLHFENDELVFADGGALTLAPAMPAITPLDMIDAGGMPVPYPTLRGKAAVALVAAMAAEDARFYGEAGQAVA